MVSLLTPLLVLLCLICSQTQAQLICTGEQEYARALAQRIGQEWPLRGSNDQVSAYVQNLGQKLAQTIAEGQSLVWHFKVMRDRSVNAFSIGNGHVYVTDGAVLFAQNESEIAAILAHEIGHQLAGHFCQSAPYRDTRWFSSFVDWLLPKQSGEVEKQAIGSLTQVIDASKEQQADQYAVIILKATGYDPKTMLAVARRLPRQDGIDHLQDHRRIEALENLLAATKDSKPSQNSAEFQQVKNKLAAE